MAIATVSSHAVDNTSLAMTPVQWQDLHQSSPQDIVGLGADLFGDNVDLFSGGLSFTQTDVSLPGNDRLNVSVGRRYQTGRREVNRHFGDWDLEIPHLTGYFPRSAGWTGVNNPPAGSGGQQTADPLARCTKFGIPFNLGSVSGMTYRRTDYWQGNILHIPGAGRQEILSRVQYVPYTGYVTGPNTIQPSDGNTYPLVTKGNWQIRCLGSLARGAGEGFLAVSPDGTQYRFDLMVARDITPIKMGTSYGQFDEVWIMPTQVRDRFGNTVTYTYDSVDPWRLLQISASDGRQLNIGYRSDGRIWTASDGTRTWTYNYAADGSLASVTQPDNASWTFSIRAFANPGTFTPAPECGMASLPPRNSRVGTMTHPSGAVGTFTTQYVMRNRRGFLMACDSSSGNPNLPVLAYRELGWSPLALQTKVLTGPGIEAQQWSYTYGTNGDDDAVSVSAPDGNAVRYTFGNYYSVDNGLLKRVDEGWNGTSALRTTVNTYASPQGRSYPEPVGYSDQPNDPIELGHRPLLRREITQQDVTMILQTDSFDSFARATAITRSSALGMSRSESTQFYDHLGLWVLGQVQTQNAAGIQANRIDFDSANALPSAYYYFGALKNRYTFRADGTLSSVSDGLNQATTFADYKRGIPQSIGYADGRSMSAVVDDIGNLTSVTNEAGTTWTYGYDAMGRIARKTPPAGDPVAYNPTTLSFVQVPNDEYGIGANHWRQTITTGNAVAINYFDARWRKRLTLSYDAANTAATMRMQRFDYDPFNRTTFAAYPARSINAITAVAPGTATTYDALGRVIKTISDSELGPLSTTTEYLSAFQKRYTDAKGNKTTTSYYVFDEPSEDAIAAITAPEGLTVTITRDAFSKPTSIARSGSYGGSAVSAVRRYVYDGNQRLCKTIDPETGATIQSLDAANNVAWRATGLNLLSTTSCDQASVPAGQKIAHVYDARNRVIGTGFGDGSPSIGRSYTPDGLPLTVVSNNSTWTYGYNNRRLLTSEVLSYGGTYGVGRAYDANGNLSALAYPDGASVAFLPNALGEASQVGAYASGVSYHPNGAVAGYTLANGIVHSLTQTVRGLPLVNRDSGVLQDQYAYDANGNVTSIADQQEGIASRSMAYDGLDRLVVANSPGVWGSGSYAYDPLGNLRTSQAGARSSSHLYDASNRLYAIGTNGIYTGYSYDAQGNVNGRGTQGFYFDLGNRMQLANDKASYAYDGLGRRVGISAYDGSSRMQVYSQAGQLLYGTRQTGGSTQITKYIYLAGKTIAEVSSTAQEPSYLYTDALGSPVAMHGTVPAALSYTCPSGWSLAGNTCTQGTTSTIAATVSGYTCPSGYALSGSTCTQSTTSTSAATPNYSCPAGYSLSGTTCVYSSSSPATPVYACPAGFTLSGTTCSGSSTTAATSSWDCKGYGSLQPLSGSPSGYYCVARALPPQDSDACPDIAASLYGLAYAGYRQTSQTTGTCYVGPVAKYSCPSGATLSGTTCTTSVTQAATVSSYTCSAGTLSGTNCVTSSSTAASVTYSCPAGQQLSGATCTASYTSTVAGTPYYSCPAGYTLSGTSCSISGTATQAATASYSCASGTLSGFNCTGALTRTRYEAYGNTAAGTVPSGIGFTGHVNDPDTGLVYMQQRYYDPIAARFLSVDPIVTDANTGKAFNLYEYANSNPYRFTDPDGRDSWSQEPTTTVTKQSVTGSNIPQTTTTTSGPGPNGVTTVTTSGPLGAMTFASSNRPGATTGSSSQSGNVYLGSIFDPSKVDPKTLLPLARELEPSNPQTPRECYVECRAALGIPGAVTSGLISKGVQAGTTAAGGALFGPPGAAGGLLLGRPLGNTVGFFTVGAASDQICTAMCGWGLKNLAQEQMEQHK
jgi:RHS repeat-associated protein